MEAEVLDLAHGSLFMGGARIIGGANVELMRDSDIVVITAGAKQKPGQTRLELADVNVKIIRSVLPTVLGVAPNAIIIVVSNPCDVLATAALKISGLPAERIFSSGTVLDSGRLRWLLSEKLSVHPSNIHAAIVGEHGDSQFPLWSQARIGPCPLLEWCGDAHVSPADLDELALSVKNAAYKIIEGKGATNYAIGVAVTEIIDAICKDSNKILPVSRVLQDYHGVSGVALAVPTIVNRKGAAQSVLVPMSEDEKTRLTASAAKIQETLKGLGV